MMKLYRSRRDSKLFGLCGGLAEQLNVDPTLLRLVTVVTAVFSGGTVIPLYILASIVIPKEPILNVPPYAGGGTMYGGAPHTGAGYPPHAGYYPGAAVPKAAPQPEPASAHIDEMMKDIEKKALQKEIEELRAKVAQYEKGDK